ncbi:hypothetical protein MTX78_11570 [Hymenobacter tibetensis]|jgi:hypothetical protein|uniref:Uncharacterized protein n=1 Tax=Hymenobacter tibetensis TaxID=497967 RepID=A0ABY4CU98_9BACT|nr:hypothetical protein [Hymenobacter tibetensis]UOG72765.1 hypothetical protein MTX78_11570 [Hymenobacter tibetensis]
MEPEEEFLDNAFTMAHYARQEIQQFLTWTNTGTPYGQAAAALLLKLDTLAAEIKALKQQYERK